MAKTIDIMFELLDNIPDKRGEAKVFVYGQSMDMDSDPSHAFEYTEYVFGVKAKSEEEGKILLQFQSVIIEGYESATRRGKDVLKYAQENINYYYGDQTVEQMKDYLLKIEPFYEVHTFDSGEKIIFEIKTYEGPKWIEKYYTGDSEDFLRSYEINMEENEVKIWDMYKIKKGLNNIRSQ